MKKLTPKTRRILAWIAIVAYLIIVGFLILSQTKGIQPVSEVCGPVGYARQATQPGFCK